MLGATTIPLTILVDANGRVLKKVRGSREWDSPNTIDAIAEVFHLKLTHKKNASPQVDALDPMYGLRMLPKK